MRAGRLTLAKEIRCQFIILARKDDRRGERVTLQQTIHALPGDFAGAVATAKPFPPEPDDTPPESVQRIRVACDPVVREVAAKLLTQCLVLVG